MRFVTCEASPGTARRHGRIAADLLAVVLIIAALGAHAQNVEDFGAYRIHYSCSVVARSYGIVRSSGRGLINIAVQRTADGGTSAPVRAALQGTATSLAGQRTPLNFREIAEEGAVYYIAEFPISAPDTYRFRISVTPESATSTNVLKFSQDFVAD